MTFEEFIDRWKCQGFRFHISKLALQLCLERGAKIFVETGCVRKPANRGHARSTVLYADFIRHFGGHLTTIDVKKKNIERARQYTEKITPNVKYIVSDAVEALREIEGPIDFLYLDSLGWNKRKPMIATEYQIRELEAVADNIHTDTVVLLDDNLAEFGRTLKSVPYLQKRGWIVLSQGHQVLLVHKDSDFEFNEKRAWKLHKPQDPYVAKDWYKAEKEEAKARKEGNLETGA